MNLTNLRVCLLGVGIILLSTCGRKENRENKVRIASASNMQFAMQELIRKFTANTGIECELILSSSGKLTAQIREGAPYDIFVAANMKYPEEIHKSGLAKTPPKIYAYGKLVLWSMDENSVPSLDLLTVDSIEHIALANPKTAPYGVAAIEVLEHYRIYDKLKDKLVFGESIAQTNQFVVFGAAEVGFTAMSVVKSPEMKGKGSWAQMDAPTYAPLEQGIVVVKSATNENKAMEFYNFIFSEQAKKILVYFGYSVDE
jgi:molybdate transport system substrate-binding protein